jgi:membrane protein
MRHPMSHRVRSVTSWLTEVIGAMRAHDLLTYASATAFQVLTAIVPFLLFAFGLLGFLDLTDIWRDDFAPDVKGSVSPAAFTVIDDTVTRVLTSGQLFWLTAGLAVAVWQISGAVRGLMKALDRVYRARRERPWKERVLVSLALAVAVGVCLLLAIAVGTLGPLVYGDAGAIGGALLFLVRWGMVAALLLLAVGILVRYGPATPQPLAWVSFGSLLVIGAWIVTSLAFGFYLRAIADYGTIFGHLASVVILLAYLYMSTFSFMFGVQADALVRQRVSGRRRVRALTRLLAVV